MSNRIITISRQFGSGGRTIAKEVAKQLDIPCYDDELITKIAEKNGLSREYIRERGEYTPGTSLFANAVAGRDYNGHSIRDELWSTQDEIILELADAGPCVIVGRCADFILKDKADLLTVFIHASMKNRAERIVRVYGESDISPEKRLRDKDKRRKAYYQFYTDAEWGNVRSYQLCLDSGILGIEKCVDVITSLY